jgi:hypothetical protein
MDSNGLLKSRIARALVEGIFRRARYQVARIGCESRADRLADIDRDDFVPDLLVWKTGSAESDRLPLHRLVAIEIRYRAEIERSLTPEIEDLAAAVTRWPELYLVYVTDRPAPGSSCFQAVDLRDSARTITWTTASLHEITGLDICWRDVQEYEDLVNALFPVLSGALRGPGAMREPSGSIADRLPIASGILS